MEKQARLLDIIRRCGSAVVAFSGGVDSAVLARAAVEALGDKAVAITAQSELLPEEELAEAVQLAALIGIRHVILRTPDLENEKFAANDKERCYYCKRARFDFLVEWAQAEGIQTVMEGSNADDDQDYRPGMRAVAEIAAVSSPLAAAGFTKQEIRALARVWKLPVWNKPSAACLASRLSYGLEITAARLRQVAAAERIVRAYAAGQVRVRHHGDLARIEVEMPMNLLGGEIQSTVTKALKSLGFTFVTVDLEGYRMGSNNEILQR